jgi:hypothetical protein
MDLFKARRREKRNTTARRFPPPWSVEEYNDACFIVRDHDGQQLAYVYFEDEAPSPAMSVSLAARKPSVGAALVK